MRDGRSFEHSREQFEPHFAASRERNSHIGAVYEYWRKQGAASRSRVPAQHDYFPDLVVPAATPFTAVIDVGQEDLNRFYPLCIGPDAIGLSGFRQQSPEIKLSDRIHNVLLVDLLWVKMDYQPIYIETELIIDEVTARYVYMLLPAMGDRQTIDRIHVVTRPVLGAAAALEESL